MNLLKYIQKTFQAYRAGQINSRITRKFLLIVGSVTGGYLLVASVVTITLLASNSNTPTSVRNPYNPPSRASSAPSINGHAIEITAEEDDDGGLLRPPSRTNVLILGVDHFNLADVIIVGSFERDTGNINLLHIPRDTFAQLPQSRIDSAAANGLWFPSHGMLKINAIRSLGRDFGVQYMQEQLSETLGIEFHYFVEIHLDAFREIVDLIGGVEMEVPRRMSYHDPENGVHIEIPAGVHLLDGVMAEGFVRYRSSYPDGDIGRINAQQQFMTQLFRQSMRRETIMNDPISMARIAISHVQTDIGLDLIRYIPYIANLSPDRIFTYTLPGNERRVQGIGSAWVPDAERIPEVINRMFFGGLSDNQEEDPQSIQVMAASSPSRSARIAVLNGTNIGGIARNIADHLDMRGYQIVHIDRYTGNFENRTRINVREEGLGYDLVDYFQNAVVRVDNRISADFDIVIIVGRSEQ